MCGKNIGQSLLRCRTYFRDYFRGHTRTEKGAEGGSEPAFCLAKIINALGQHSRIRSKRGEKRDFEAIILLVLGFVVIVVVLQIATSCNISNKD